MKKIYVDTIAEMLGVRDWQVENCVKLFEEGATIPFISRYRKERTGGLDEVAVAEVRHWADVFVEMEKRKATVLENIEAAGALTDELKAKVEDCVDSRELEDLYLPFRLSSWLVYWTATLLVRVPASFVSATRSTFHS